MIAIHATVCALSWALVMYLLRGFMIRRACALSTFLNLLFFALLSSYNLAHAASWHRLLLAHHELDRSGTAFMLFLGYMLFGWFLHLLWSLINCGYTRDKWVNAAVGVIACASAAM